MEEKNTKSKKSWILVTILVVLLLIATGLGGYLLGASRIANDVVKQKVEQEKTTGPLEVTEAVKTRLERFIKVATKPSYTGGGTLDNFKGGLSSLTKEVKYKMTNNYVYDYGTVEKGKTITDTEINNLNGLKPESNEIVDKVKVADFNSAYKTLFNEDPSYEIEDLKGGCPSPAAIDKAGEVLYYFHRCGGASMTSYDNQITSYDSDSNCYYIHQVLTEKNGETGQTTTTKLLWKFDSKFNFISTTVE